MPPFASRAGDEHIRSTWSTNTSENDFSGKIIDFVREKLAKNSKLVGVMRQRKIWRSALFSQLHWTTSSLLKSFSHGLVLNTIVRCKFVQTTTSEWNSNLYSLYWPKAGQSHLSPWSQRWSGKWANPARSNDRSILWWWTWGKCGACCLALIGEGTSRGRQWRWLFLQCSSEKERKERRWSIFRMEF